MKRRNFLTGAASLSTILISGIGLAKETRMNEAACIQHAGFKLFYPQAHYESPKNFMREKHLAEQFRKRCIGKTAIMVFYTKSLEPVHLSQAVFMSDVMIVKTIDHKEIVVFKNRITGEVGLYRDRWKDIDEKPGTNRWGFDIEKVVAEIDYSDKWHIYGNQYVPTKEIIRRVNR
jgi:hypothetical protein